MHSLLLDRPAAVLRFLDFPGTDLPLIFIHGLGCAGSSDFPRTVMEPAIASHRRIVMDLFGHGFSDAPPDFGYTLEAHADAVAKLIDHMQLKECGIFGHSMGGSVAITLAARRPDLVSRLILAEANLDPGGGLISKGIAAQTEDEFTRTGLRALIDELVASDDLTLAGTFRVSDPHGFYQSAVGLVRGTMPTMRERLYALRIPRAYLIGERSLPDPDTGELPKHGVRVPIIAGAGHGMMVDNPAGVATAIAQQLSAQPV